MKIRNLEKSDRAQWDPLWQAYLVFYETSIPDHTTDITWERFFDDSHVFTGFYELGVFGEDESEDFKRK